MVETEATQKSRDATKDDAPQTTMTITESHERAQRRIYSTRMQQRDEFAASEDFSGFDSNDLAARSEIRKLA
jgi:hypothetical protein